MAERIEFTGSQGDRLAARLELPTRTPDAYAIFAHCFTCSKDVAAASRVSRALAERGIGVLRFDFTGLGHSDGEFPNTNFSSNVDDVVHAARWLRDHRAAPSLLVGHSLGGAAVLAAAQHVPEAKAIATIGAPADPAHLKKLLSDQAAAIASRGEVMVEIAGRRFPIRRQFLEDIGAHNLEKQIRSLRRALLVLHAPADAVVGIENASRIFQTARHPKSFVSLDGADHLLSRRADSSYAAEVIAAWASRYLPTPALAVRAETEEGEIVVIETRESEYSQSVAAGRHLLRADEPVAMGGGDSGPTPYGLLLASLGTCTSMTLRMYANRKQLPLERVTVRLQHEKIHAKDCAECEAADGKVDRIQKEIGLEGNLDDAQRKRLLEIADRCPVHRTLHSEVSIESRLAPTEAQRRHLSSRLNSS